MKHEGDISSSKWLWRTIEKVSYLTVKCVAFCFVHMLRYTEKSFLTSEKSRKEQDVLVTVLASFHKMLHALLRATDNLVLWCQLAQDWGVSFLRENLWNTWKNKRVFYRHYITAAAHWKHWPTFLHTVTCSTVAEREEAGGGGGGEDSALSMQHGGRSREREEARVLTLSLSGYHKCLYNDKRWRNSLFTDPLYEKCLHWLFKQDTTFADRQNVL